MSHFGNAALKQWRCFDETSGVAPPPQNRTTMNTHPDHLRPVDPLSAPGDFRHATRGVDRVQALIHELANLVDGSLRMLESARRSLASHQREQPESETILRNVDGAHAALSHIAALVRSAQPSSEPRLIASQEAPGTLHSAIRSALELLKPAASSRNIVLESEIDATVRGIPADEIYAVISNGVRNAMEAIRSVGRITVRARVERSEVVLEILDDGVGPPKDNERAFELGYSTKPGSSGVGLALAREVITELRGVIELLPRGLDVPGRPGAILRATYPVPPQPRLMGGLAC